MSGVVYSSGLDSTFPMRFYELDSQQLSDALHAQLGIAACACG